MAKIKYIWTLYWQGEEIDRTDTIEEAHRLQQEYSIAFKGYVSIKKVRSTEE